MIFPQFYNNRECNYSRVKFKEDLVSKNAYALYSVQYHQ